MGTNFAGWLLARQGTEKVLRICVRKCTVNSLYRHLVPSSPSQEMLKVTAMQPLRLRSMDWRTLSKIQVHFQQHDRHRADVAPKPVSQESAQHTPYSSKSYTGKESCTIETLRKNILPDKMVSIKNLHKSTVQTKPLDWNRVATYREIKAVPDINAAQVQY